MRVFKYNIPKKSAKVANSALFRKLLAEYYGLTETSLLGAMDEVEEKFLRSKIKNGETLEGVRSRQGMDKKIKEFCIDTTKSYLKGRKICLNAVQKAVERVYGLSKVIARWDFRESGVRELDYLITGIENRLEVTVLPEGCVFTNMSYEYKLTEDGLKVFVKGRNKREIKLEDQLNDAVALGGALDSDLDFLRYACGVLEGLLIERITVKPAVPVVDDVVRELLTEFDEYAGGCESQKELSEKLMGYLADTINGGMKWVFASKTKMYHIRNDGVLLLRTTGDRFLSLIDGSKDPVNLLTSLEVADEDLYNFIGFAERYVLAMKAMMKG